MEISPSLLLSDAAAPSNGVSADKPIYWPGGELAVIYTGAFSGASAQLVFTVNMPPQGKVPDDPTDWMNDDDWINLGDPITGNTKSGYVVRYGHVNPCMLALRMSGVGSGTRVKALIS